MPKHKENKIWMLRKDGESNGYVKTLSNKNLQIYYYSNIEKPEERKEEMLDTKLNAQEAQQGTNKVK